jgi:GDSL-like Lipase/Acylhydrolase family
MGLLVSIFLSLFGGLASTPQTAQKLPSAPAPRAEGEASPGATGGSSRPSKGQALVVGDSLAEGTEAPLARLLPGWRIRTSAYTGRPTADGVSEITGTGNLRPVLVVSLGTNDDPSATSTFQGQVETVLRAAGPSRCVIWANIVRPPYGGVSYAGYNRALARVAATNPNLTIVDWVGIVRRNPGVLAPDGVHATPTGYEERAREVAAAMTTCGAGTSYGGAGSGGSGAVGD